MNRKALGFFECLSLSFVSLLFCGPENSSLCSIFRQKSYQGFFKFGNPTLRPVSTITKSCSHRKEVNHWPCRPCLLNFEQEPENLSPKRYYNSMILWYYSSDWSKLNPLLIYWPSSSWSMLRIHSMSPGRGTESSSGQATAIVMCVTESCAGAECFANDTAICQSSQDTTQVASTQTSWAETLDSTALKPLSTGSLLSCNRPTYSSGSFQKDAAWRQKCSVLLLWWKKTIEETSKRGWTYVGIKRSLSHTNPRNTCI